MCIVITIQTHWLSHIERGDLKGLPYNFVILQWYLPLTPLPVSRGAVGGPVDADALAVTAAVSVDADADVHVTVAVIVDADAGVDVTPAVIVDADADADVVTVVVAVDAMLQLIMLSPEQEFV